MYIIIFGISIWATIKILIYFDNKKYNKESKRRMLAISKLREEFKNDEKALDCLNKEVKESNRFFNR